jgi:hypothetical protein
VNNGQQPASTGTGDNPNVLSNRTLLIGAAKGANKISKRKLFVRSFLTV